MVKTANVPIGCAAGVNGAGDRKQHNEGGYRRPCAPTRRRRQRIPGDSDVEDQEGGELAELARSVGVTAPPVRPRRRQRSKGRSGKR